MVHHSCEVYKMYTSGSGGVLRRVPLQCDSCWCACLHFISAALCCVAMRMGHINHLFPVCAYVDMFFAKVKRLSPHIEVNFIKASRLQSAIASGWVHMAMRIGSQQCSSVFPVHRFQVQIFG